MKKIVYLTRMNAEGTGHVPAGRVVLEGGTIRYEDLNEKFIATLNEGIIGRAADGVLYPADGLRFLEGLQREFSGTMIRASEVYEIE